MTPQPDLDHTLLALADPTRRAILQRLSSGEARVTEIARPFAMSLNAVSKHILVLERAQLVRRRRAGREHFLSFNPKPLDQAAKWIEAQRASGRRGSTNWSGCCARPTGRMETEQSDERLR